tara:strand:- start:59 stop:199 length:141 start_codon:yes stop_codon:yes gene_type:complete
MLGQGLLLLLLLLLIIGGSSLTSHGCASFGDSNSCNVRAFFIVEVL